MNKNLKILFAVSEAVPFAKTGGLADVAGALPKALFNLGCEVKAVMPKYKIIDDKKYNLKKVADLPGGGVLKYTVLQNSAIGFYFIENDAYFNRNELYSTKGGDYPDNAERFIYFNKSVLEMLKIIEFKPDCIHCNDWQTGLIPVYLKLLREKDGFYKNIGLLLTIHNMAYQGIFPKETMDLSGLPWDLFTMDKLEYWDHLNFMKAGLVYADVINTVSETYSKEIQSSSEFGMGLEGVLENRGNDVYGIINGVDYDEWSPVSDKEIPINYDLISIGKKIELKKTLLIKSDMPFDTDVAAIGMISRLADQKGFDILAGIIEELVNLKLQLVILGTGDAAYHNLLEKLEEKYPHKVSINLKFDNKLAHLIYAGSDLFLMPSRYEPCGLGQLISFKYGTVPIVRATGGLADTVKNYNPKTGTGNGFVFSEYSSKLLLATVKNAIEIFKNKRIWAKLIINGMNMDFSWNTSAKKYVDLYQKAIIKANSNKFPI